MAEVTIRRFLYNWQKVKNLLGHKIKFKYRYFSVEESKQYIVTDSESRLDFLFAFSSKLTVLSWFIIHSRISLRIHFERTLIENYASIFNPVCLTPESMTLAPWLENVNFLNRSIILKFGHFSGPLSEMKSSWFLGLTFILHKLYKCVQLSKNLSSP